MINTPIKILLIIFCLLGIYSFLLTLSPNKSRGLFGNMKPLVNLKDVGYAPTPKVGGLAPTVAPLNAGEVVVVVNFDGVSFSPANVNVKVGQKVIFKNNSNKDGMWIASDPHPLHNLYPELDSKMVIDTTKTYEFTASKVGSWGYHDHIQPSITGVLVISSQ